MAVEKVQLNVTLSGGECVWQKGTVLSSPLPPTILKEIESNTGTVTVLEISNDGKEQLSVDIVIPDSSSIFDNAKIITVYQKTGGAWKKYVRCSVLCLFNQPNHKGERKCVLKSLLFNY